MGLLTLLRRLKKDDKEARILVLGLDNAGKVSVIYILFFMYTNIYIIMKNASRTLDRYRVKILSPSTPISLFLSISICISYVMNDSNTWIFKKNIFFTCISL